MVFSFQKTPENRPPSKNQRNRRDVASRHRSGEPLQVKHVWEEMLIMSQKLIFRLRGNLVSPESTFPPFYSCFIQYFPCIKFQSKTQKRKKRCIKCRQSWGCGYGMHLSSRSFHQYKKPGPSNISLKSTWNGSPTKRSPEPKAIFLEAIFPLMFLFLQQKCHLHKYFRKMIFPKKTVSSKQIFPLD